MCVDACSCFLSDNVTVIIVNWNGEQFLERCLTALLAQTAKPHEIILLDNASTDGSIEIARRLPAVPLLLNKTSNLVIANDAAA